VTLSLPLLCQVDSVANAPLILPLAINTAKAAVALGLLATLQHAIAGSVDAVVPVVSVVSVVPVVSVVSVVPVPVVVVATIEINVLSILFILIIVSRVFRGKVFRVKLLLVFITHVVLRLGGHILGVKGVFIATAPATNPLAAVASIAPAQG
jgi:hypothetical protein